MQAQGNTVPEAYAEFASGVFSKVTSGGHSKLSTSPLDVAQAVWTAVTDPAAPMCLPAGADAVALANSQ